jgi:hypothetical protein
MDTPSTPKQTPPASSKAWIWILIIVVLVLLIGGVIAAFVLTREDKTVVVNNLAANVTNTATNTVTNEPVSEELEDLSEAEEAAIAEYVTGILPVLDDLTAALEKWEKAADLGSAGDFDASTESLQEGLDDIADAEGKLAALEVIPQVERINELMEDALAKTEEALTLGIEGNESDDVDKIEESGNAIDEVAEILEEATEELDKISAALGI